DSRFLGCQEAARLSFLDASDVELVLPLERLHGSLGGLAGVVGGQCGLALLGGKGAVGGRQAVDGRLGLLRLLRDIAQRRLDLAATGTGGSRIDYDTENVILSHAASIPSSGRSYCSRSAGTSHPSPRSANGTARSRPPRTVRRSGQSPRTVSHPPRRSRCAWRRSGGRMRARPTAGGRGPRRARRPTVTARPCVVAPPRPRVATRRRSVPSRVAPSVSRVFLDLVEPEALGLVRRDQHGVVHVAILREQQDGVVVAVVKRLIAVLQPAPVEQDRFRDALDHDPVAHLVADAAPLPSVRLQLPAQQPLALAVPEARDLHLAHLTQHTELRPQAIDLCGLRLLVRLDLAEIHDTLVLCS